MDYDVVVAGGSVAGLLCAREIALQGHKVLVIEEDYEIGHTRTLRGTCKSYQPWMILESSQ
ncbi:Digeranylgeranylglycerophospholipid reductase [Candidatus Nitrosotalea sp. TS]|uniref:FAD-dependent oxidoreductase n=1 Tax=Candidatus Nitrosotalea sp. TS TaxID=2341020 RepID=UPI001EBF8B9F|nr:FAD-dependent oxidoreductase [Candidatus Nitrosotalea sp. TS]NHI02980.1 Digeranylgeranylglycerophospholipid reductase [Candidatus Nitrosotalea sp. TS]